MMKLSEFAKILVDNKGIFTNKHGEILPIIIWQDLITIEEFKKTIKINCQRLLEDEFVAMARRPIVMPMRPILKLIEADPYKAQDTTLNTREFYPDLDEGWAIDSTTEIRVHLYYYER